MSNLADKVIIVTGGSGLIGREVCKCCLNNLAIVINLDINEIDDSFISNSSRFQYIKFDITNDNHIKDTLRLIYDKYGHIDGIVNVSYPRTKDWGNTFEDVSLESWRKNVDMQLNSLFAIIQEATKYMNKGSAFVNFASIYGVVGNDFTVYDGTSMTSPAAYSAIKGGVINFSRYLASYLGKKGIRVNCVSPGGVFDHQNATFVENYSRKCPLKRMAYPCEIAPAVCFLLSDEASYITGHNLLVDGGWCAI